MEIRGIHESELEEMIDLQCQVFRPDGHERYWQYVRAEPSYRYDQSRVVVVDGQVVSTLRVWERQMRIGSIAIPMGGIGGVGTHLDHRGAGYATALMKDTIDYMRTVGYDVGVLFSAIPCTFYRKLGWASVPLAGFRVTRRQNVGLEETEWHVEAFDEERDLEASIALYDKHNAQQSGALVRPRSYWDSGTARLRNILPTTVARQGNRFGGYLNFQIEGQGANILEVAYDRTHPQALTALVSHLLQVCEREGVEELHGDIPHRHPMVNLLTEGTAGDTFLTGNSAMMLYAVNLSMLFRRLLPELQTRVDAANQKFAPVSICFVLNNQEAGLRLLDDGTLQTFEPDEQTTRLAIPEHLFWQALLGEASWDQLEPTLHQRGITVERQLAALLSTLLPQREVIFWAPDHY